MILPRAARVRWGATIAALVCASCATSEPGGDDDGSVDDGEFDPIEYPILVATAICEPLTRCCPLLGEAVEGFEGCLAVMSVAVFPNVTDIGNSLDAGRSEYRERVLRDCVDATKQLDCDGFVAGEDPEACKEPYLVGLVPLGEYCQEHFECIDGYCVDSACVPLLMTDDACAEDGECSSHYCNDVCRPADERDVTCH